MTQRMHILTIVGLPGAVPQDLYDNGDMPDGTWKRLDDNTILLSVVLDDTPIECEIEIINTNIDPYGATIISVGPEIDHYDLDPCFS